MLLWLVQHVVQSVPRVVSASGVVSLALTLWCDKLVSGGTARERGGLASEAESAVVRHQ